MQVFGAELTRQPENAPENTAPPPAPEAPSPGRLPRRRGTVSAAGGRAPEKARLTGIRVKVPVEALDRKLGEPARGGVGRQPGPDRGAVQRGEGRRGQVLSAGQGARERLQAVRGARRRGSRGWGRGVRNDGSAGCRWRRSRSAAVRGPKHVVTKGSTPVLSPAGRAETPSAVDPGTLAGLRDRALLSVMLYSFARVSPVLAMRRQNYFQQGEPGVAAGSMRRAVGGTTSRPPPPGGGDPRRLPRERGPKRPTGACGTSPTCACIRTTSATASVTSCDAGRPPAPPGDLPVLARHAGLHPRCAVTVGTCGRRSRPVDLRQFVSAVVGRPAGPYYPALPAPVPDGRRDLAASLGNPAGRLARQEPESTSARPAG